MTRHSKVKVITSKERNSTWTVILLWASEVPRRGNLVVGIYRLGLSPESLLQIDW